MSDRLIRDEALTIYSPDARRRRRRSRGLSTCSFARAARRVRTARDMPRLPYTLAVFSEVLRLNPPVWFLGRRACGEVAFGGIAFPPARS
jgi:cytochrome P450